MEPEMPGESSVHFVMHSDKFSIAMVGASENGHYCLEMSCCTNHQLDAQPIWVLWWQDHSLQML